MTDLMELASRVEAGEGPDRGLDADIQDAVRLGGYKADRDGCSGRLCGTMTRMASDGDGVEWKPLPAFTGSTDAAMSLVNGVGVLTGLSDIGADGLPMARVGCPQFDGAPIFVGIASCIMTKTAPVAGLAIALTAAALRAWAHQGAAHVDQ